MVWFEFNSQVSPFNPLLNDDKARVSKSKLISQIEVKPYRTESLNFHGTKRK